MAREHIGAAFAVAFTYSMVPHIPAVNGAIAAGYAVLTTGLLTTVLQPPEHPREATEEPRF